MSYLSSKGIIHQKNPWEMLHGRKPDVSHLRVFRSRVYMQVTRKYRDKLDARSAKGFLLGYPEGTKGYRIIRCYRPYWMPVYALQYHMPHVYTSQGASGLVYLRTRQQSVPRDEYARMLT